MDAMTSTTAPAQAPADQLAAAQRDNTRLIAQIVALEAERDAALRDVDRLTAALSRAAREAVAREGVFAAAPGRCDHCGLPLVAGHIADEVVITNGKRRAHVHRACASAYSGWEVVIRARGM